MGFLWWDRGPDERYLECRRCGTPVEGSEGPCPVCGASDIAVYEF